MVSTDLLLKLLSVSLIIKAGICNVIRHHEIIQGVILSTADDGGGELTEGNSVEEDDIGGDSDKDDRNYIVLNRLVKLDDNSNMKLNDDRSLEIGIEHIIHHKTSVHHFARHGLCRNDKGKIRLYTALKSKLCHTEREFIAQLVNDLCDGQGSHLDFWVAELFDINDDGVIDHFEKTLFDD